LVPNCVGWLSGAAAEAEVDASVLALEAEAVVESARVAGR
jgi:hypothetical protein